MKETLVKNRGFIRKTDSYKVTHWQQLPPKTTGLFSFFESRGGKFTETTFFGLQYILKRHFVGNVVTEEDIAESKRKFALHFGSDALFNEAGWRYILEKHGGRLPLRIKAVPEGTTVPTGNVLVTIENTDPNVPWLTNYAETLLSQVWYPMTVATNSREMRKVILRYLDETGDPSLIDFKLHDFGYRGSTSDESAAIGGSAHLVNFKGTDTLAALDLLDDYYREPMAGFSIPAAEHSTITSWLKKGEREAFEHMLATYPTGLVAVVSDSYDIFSACRNLWGGALKARVLSRDGTLVVRPDSGPPPETVLKVIEILGHAFGYERNAKGYKILNPHVRIIQGDGIDYEMVGLILETLKQAGWSADNAAFGSGGGLLQKFDRDTQKCAVKCSAVLVDGIWFDVQKDPVTDHGKRSKAGRLELVQTADGFKTLREDEAMRSGRMNELMEVFRNGELIVDQGFAQVRERALR
jgi:nicotinamide phosphoribosyltransferase